MAVRVVKYQRLNHERLTHLVGVASSRQDLGGNAGLDKRGMVEAATFHVGHDTFEPPALSPLSLCVQHEGGSTPSQKASKHTTIVGDSV